MRLCSLLMSPRRTGGIGKRSQLLNRTQPDAVGLAQGAVDSACFCDAHLSSVDHEGHVGGVGVTVTDETFRARRLVDGCLEDPAIVRCITQFRHGVGMNSMAMVFLGYA